MRKTRRFALSILVFALLLSLIGSGRASAAGGGGAREVVGYYASWAAAQGHTPDKLPAEQFTQINYAFAKLEDGRAVLGDPVRDGKTLRELTGLRDRKSVV